MKVDNKPGRAFFPEDYGVPIYEELILITHPDNKKKSELKLFIKALNKATKLIREDPNLGWKLFVQYKPQELDTPLNEMAWADTIPKLMYPVEQTDPQVWNAFSKFMVENKLIKTHLPPEIYLMDLE